MNLASSNTGVREVLSARPGEVLDRVPTRISNPYPPMDGLSNLPRAIGEDLEPLLVGRSEVDGSESPRNERDARFAEALIEFDKRWDELRAACDGDAIEIIDMLPSPSGYFAKSAEREARFAAALIEFDKGWDELRAVLVGRSEVDGSESPRRPT